MDEADRDLCRKAAAECVELARATTDPHKKEILLIRSQEWLKLAYAGQDADFERLLSQFNSEQMSFRAQSPQRRVPVQRQPMQQQQQKKNEEDQ